MKIAVVGCSGRGKTHLAEVMWSTRGESLNQSKRGGVKMGELIIRGGTVIDGTGRPGEINDLLVRDGIITEIGNLSGRNADREINA